MQTQRNDFPARCSLGRYARVKTANLILASPRTRKQIRAQAHGNESSNQRHTPQPPLLFLFPLVQTLLEPQPAESQTRDFNVQTNSIAVALSSPPVLPLVDANSLAETGNSFADSVFPTLVHMGRLLRAAPSCRTILPASGFCTAGAWQQ